MVGWIIAALIVLFIAVLLVRGAAFRPKPAATTQPEEVSFDAEAAANALAELVRCKTISYNDSTQEDDAEFKKLTDLLPKLYPHIFNACSLQEFPGRALLFRWQGKSDKAPTVLMSHYDVVPVREDLWEKPPFAGIIEDGVLWGRGTLDTKVTMNAALSAAEHLVCQGFVPENDIYFAFSGGEEVNGPGAQNIVNYFAQHSIRPALVLDEGGAVVEGVFPGVKAPCGLVGIAEKGMINVCYTVHSGGGHASAPPVKTPLTTLSKACCNIIRHPFPMQINSPAAAMFNTLGRHSTFVYRVLFANLWLFKPALDLICRMSGGDLNALVRTTTAFTQAQGSQARNVIPAEAKLVSNMRLNPTDRVATSAAYLKKVVNDPSVEIEILESNEPSAISKIDCESWQKVADSVTETWNGTIVSPYLMVQCSDSRHYGEISDYVYRFSAMDLTAEERKTIHGNNERIRLETIAHSVEFYIRLIKKC